MVTFIDIQICIELKLIIFLLVKFITKIIINFVNKFMKFII